MGVYQERAGDQDIDLDQLIGVLQPSAGRPVAPDGSGDFQERMRIVPHHWRVAVGGFLLCTAVGAALALAITPEWEARGRLVAEPLAATGKPLAANDRLAELLTRKLPNASTQAETIQGDAVLQEAAARLHLPPGVRPAVEAQVLPGTDVVEITATGRDRELVARTPNVVMEVFLRSVRLSELGQVRKVRGLLREEYAATAKAARAAENELTAFKQRTGLRSGNGAWRTQAAQVARGQARLQAMDLELVRRRQQLEELRKIAVQDSAGFGLQPGTEAAVPAELQTLEAKVDRLQAARNDLSRQLAEMRGSAERVAGWQAALTGKTRRYEEAVTRQGEIATWIRDLRLRENAVLPPARIIGRSETAADRSAPHRLVTLGYAALLGLLLGCAGAFLVAEMDDRIHSVRICRRWLGMPNLAQVPTLPRRERGRLLSRNSAAIEAYRTLTFSLRIAHQERPIRTLLVTSSSAGEGKTTTALNLAAVLALAGKRVIVVDANLRRPALARRFQLEGKPGLAEVLRGAAAADDALHATPVSGLRVMPAGRIPPNPAELLDAGGMEDVLDELDTEADVVVIDAPPALDAPEAQLLAARTDAVLLVVQMSRTRRAELQEVRDLLQSARARVLGAVTNRVSRRHGSLIRFGR